MPVWATASNEGFSYPAEVGSIPSSAKYLPIHSYTTRWHPTYRVAIPIWGIYLTMEKKTDINGRQDQGTIPHPASTNVVMCLARCMAPDGARVLSSLQKHWSGT